MGKTDLENFIALYKSFGLDLETSEITSTSGTVIVLGGYGSEGDNTQPQLTVGYSGFCSEIEFDKEGKFISQGFWE
jgi:hypothetical protein